MIFEKYKKNEEGYLLLDSLASLIIVLAVLLMFIPLMTDWLGNYSTAKVTVEESRRLYEDSMEIKNKQISRHLKGDRKKSSNNEKLTNETRMLGIEIMEISFTYE